MTRAIIAQRPKRYYYRTGDGKLHWAPYLGITLPGTDTGNEKLVPPDTSPSHRNRSKSGSETDSRRRSVAGPAKAVEVEK